MADRTYVGKGKIVGRYGNIRIGLRADALIPNERGYCDIIIAEMKQPDKFGNTHTAYLDDYIAKGKKEEDPF